MQQPQPPPTPHPQSSLERSFNCLKCKQKRTSSTYEKTVTKHGRSRLGSKCDTCGSKMSKFGK